jgi:hypothetical protein
MRKMVVDKVVREEAGGEEEEAPGIQNQKQEPHTKLWGKKIPKEYCAYLSYKHVFKYGLYRLHLICYIHDALEAK